MPELWKLLDSKVVLSAASAIVGALFGSYVALLRGRVRVLEYTVTHDRVGVSAQDAFLGNVAVTWQGTALQNLYLSTVILENGTSSNYTDLTFRVWTGTTLLLNERREIVGTVYPLEYTVAYRTAIQIPPGAEPTPEQHNMYWHNREYALPVFNRKQRVVLRYLTTVRDADVNTGPSVWVALQHQGLDVRFRPNVPQIHGVPVKLAAGIGLGVCVGIVLLVSWSGNTQTWTAATVSMMAGLVAQSIGAGLYWSVRFLYRIIVH